MTCRISDGGDPGIAETVGCWMLGRADLQDPRPARLHSSLRRHDPDQVQRVPMPRSRLRLACGFANGFSAPRGAPLWFGKGRTLLGACQMKAIPCAGPQPVLHRKFSAVIGTVVIG
jgi:hypothetical protein